MRRFGWRGIIFLLLAAGLSGCLNVTQGRTVDDDLSDYEQSLREEAGWLWDNMNDARASFSPDAEHCRVRTFDHTPVLATESLRDTDGTAADLAEQLVYAKLLIDEAQARWFAFCRGEASASLTASTMEAQLRPAYNSLNTVQSTLTQRAAAAAKGK